MFRALSWNIRYGSANDGENRWDNRRKWVVEVLKAHAPAIIGLQEALRFQLDELLAELPDYDWVGGGRDDGRDRGELTPILYLRDRFRLVDWSLAWLSEQPQKPGSIGWDARLPRICTRAALRFPDSGQTLQIFNVHLDHHGPIARLQGAKQVQAMVRRPESDHPSIIMGDFNSGERDAPMQTFLQSSQPPRWLDAFRQIHPDAVETGTRHDFTGDAGGMKIDHLLVDAERLRVLDAGIDRSCRNGRFPSDHFAVWTDIDFAKAADF